MTALLRVEALARSFGGVRALAGISFGVEAGEVFGIIGPNGAGKTTLFNVITGALQPSGGSVRLAGRDITGLAMDAVARLGG